MKKPKPNIYDELAQIESLKDRVKGNQDLALDVYNVNPKLDKQLKDLLIEMNALLAEIDEIDEEMQELSKRL